MSVAGELLVATVSSSAAAVPGAIARGRHSRLAATSDLVLHAYLSAFAVRQAYSFKPAGRPSAGSWRDAQ
jgi:hypothetical protein